MKRALEPSRGEIDYWRRRGWTHLGEGKFQRGTETGTLYVYDDGSTGMTYTPAGHG